MCIRDRYQRRVHGVIDLHYLRPKKNIHSSHTDRIDQHHLSGDLLIMFPKYSPYSNIPQGIRPTGVTSPNSPQAYKEKGNEYFAKGDFLKAIIEYSRAIDLDDSQTTFFSNRARCFIKVNDFRKGLEDSNRAIELDDCNIKAYMLSAECLVELGRNEPDMVQLERAEYRLKKGENKLNPSER
eukprot:TRINITY_DN9139_c0_g3_i5.p1 TRINITY_DN9139_c0_g3~~TRINITY_DN9139_c0_g3_i5.p1  ORF type:complete len:182 (-),score=28.68 TRINITY_DN9139_c0_g3_i5:91-636(-)